VSLLTYHGLLIGRRRGVRGLFALYNAHTSPRTEDGSGIVTIGDLSGNGFTVTTRAGGGVGVGSVVSADLDGFDCIRTNGGSWDCEAAENGLGAALGSLDEFSVAYVATPISGQSGGFPYAGIFSSVAGIGAGQGNAGGYRIGGTVSISGAQWFNVASASMTPGTYDRIIVTRRSDGLTTWIKNKVEVGSTTQDVGVGSGAYLGVASWGGADFVDIKWAQMAFYDHCLDVTEYESLDDSLKALYPSTP
jgi:hypothetical protein